MRHKYAQRRQTNTTIENLEMIDITTESGVKIEEITTCTTIETLAEVTSETTTLEIGRAVETPEEVTSETTTLEIGRAAETQEEVTSETTTLEIGRAVETQEEVTSETTTLDIDQAVETKRSLLIMIGLAQNVTIPISRSGKNVIAVVNQKAEIPKEETTNQGETNRQEMTGEVETIVSQENSEKPEVNHPITHTIGVLNH